MRQEITIWQFVRIMVEAENNKEGLILLKKFGDIWNEVDTNLQNLLDENISISLQKYSDLMINSIVILKNVTRQEKDSIIEMINNVIEKIKKSLYNIENDKILNDNDKKEMGDTYLFEIHELENLVDELN